MRRSSRSTAARPTTKGMSAIDDTLKNHRRRLIEREEAAFRELLEAYDLIEAELRREIRALQRKIREAKANGEEINESWLYRERRLRSLVDQVKQQIARFGGTATRITEREQRAAVSIAAEQTRDVFRVIAGDAAPDNIGFLLPNRVVEDAVGMMGNGSPIIEYYTEQLAPKVAEMIRTEVVKAVALGTDFNTIARRLLQTGQITRSRALMVARTEVNRVRREATRQTYVESGVTTGWEWVASKSIRTCPACLFMDGRIFKLEEPFPQHPNCRCTMIPVIEGVESPPRLLGRDWFENLSDEEKEEILGIDAFEAYKRGEVTLEDFVGWRNSKEFGKSVYARSLVNALKNAVGDEADRVREILQRAGYTTTKIPSKKATNSQYVLIEKDGVKQRIRISDHDMGRRTKGTVIDIRPHSGMTDDEILSKL